MTRKELLALPKREWDEILRGVSGVYVLPTRKNMTAAGVAWRLLQSLKTGGQWSDLEVAVMMCRSGATILEWIAIIQVGSFTFGR